MSHVIDTQVTSHPPLPESLYAWLFPSRRSLNLPALFGLCALAYGSYSLTKRVFWKIRKIRQTILPLVPLLSVLWFGWTWLACLNVLAHVPLGKGLERVWSSESDEEPPWLTTLVDALFGCVFRYEVGIRYSLSSHSNAKLHHARSALASNHSQSPSRFT